jgi:pyoverdine/dityrosine biosynthesis protein Dit1
MKSLALSRATYVEFPELPSTKADVSHKLARDILKKILQFRRSPNSHPICDLTCPSCQSPHLSKVISAIRTAKPITFVLPAFPGKSPNLSKVFGPLPDMAEQLALQFLEQLCDRIREIYEPGAQIILCSDGRVFSDIVGMREADVTHYQHELDKMIDDLGIKALSTFNLDELCESKDFIQVRRELMETFGSPLEVLREKVLRGSKPFGRPEDEEAHRMYCGITRFLVEDSTFPGQTKSRSAIQRECKTKAYEVIRRSNAWSELISQRFPEAVRLSIHPQTCGSKKLGIILVGTESWMTPWHGVAVKTNEDFVLLKRTEAESLGAQVIFSEEGRPSHFELIKN